MTGYLITLSTLIMSTSLSHVTCHNVTHYCNEEPDSHAFLLRLDKSNFELSESASKILFHIMQRIKSNAIHRLTAGHVGIYR